MLKNILCLLYIGFSLNLYSQENKDAMAVWESKLGSENTKMVIKAVEKADTSLEINTEPIIRDKASVMPFMLLDNSSKLLFYIQEKKVPVLHKSVDVYSYKDIKLQDEQLRDVAVPRKYAVVFNFTNSRLIRIEMEGEKLAAKYSSDEIFDVQINDQYVLVYDFGKDIFTYETTGLINEPYSMAQYSWNKGLNCDLYKISLENGSKELLKKNVEPVSNNFPYFRFSKNGKDIDFAPEPKPFIKTKAVNNSRSKIDSTILTEEIRWKTFNGTMGRGVLAKPKFFDSTKKYPIIFVYYEKSVVKYPEDKMYDMGDFVDYDYLVFSPDITYTLGETGRSVFNYVISAAEHLKKLPYVDSKRMGIKGASFGGYETNYLVTHTSLFAAAISFSGYSDFVSNIGAMNSGRRPHGLEGTDQNRMGVTLWQRPDIWIKNSPIFYADRVTAPVLLIASKSDNNVPFEQSLAFFRALRSLGKRSWLLQYDDAGHIGVTSSIAGKPYEDCDFCTRQLQFFNHYLKVEPAPIWMLDGIPAREKGKKTGLELDTLGRTPGPGLRREKLILTSQQEELLKDRTMVTDEGRIIDVSKKTKMIKK